MNRGSATLVVTCALALAACAGPDKRVIPDQGIRISGAFGTGDLNSDTALNPSSAIDIYGADVSYGGAIGNSVAVILGVSTRSIHADKPAAQSGTSLELRAGLRSYFGTSEALKPFLSGGFLLGLFDGSEGLVGGYLGGGLEWFFSPEFALEATIQGEAMLINNRSISGPPGGLPNSSDGEFLGVIGFLGIGYYF